MMDLLIFGIKKIKLLLVVYVIIECLHRLQQLCRYLPLEQYPKETTNIPIWIFIYSIAILFCHVSFLFTLLCKSSVDYMG